MFYRSKFLLFFCLSFLGVSAQSTLTAKVSGASKHKTEKLPETGSKAVNAGNWDKAAISTSASCAIFGHSFTFYADPVVKGVAYQWLFEGKVVGTGVTYTIPDFEYDHVGNYQLRQLFPNGAGSDTSNIYMGNCIILPIYIGKLMGDRQKGVITLKWKAFDFHNGLSFIIERGDDGTTFEPIGTIDGNAVNNENKYSFEDRQPLPTSYYRVKRVMPGNTAIYSDVIKMYDPNIPQ